MVLLGWRCLSSASVTTLSSQFRKISLCLLYCGVSLGGFCSCVQDIFPDVKPVVAEFGLLLRIFTVVNLAS